MSRRATKNVGVIGLGIVGHRVAENLRRRDFLVFVWNRTPRPVPNFVGSPAELAQLCDWVQIFVADDAALAEVVAQLAPELTAQHIVLAHCTVAPESMRAAADVVRRRGARFLDAPFTGSKVAAEKGELVYYIGGDEAALKHSRPVLEASSKAIVHIGEIGDATVVKIATNMITAATVQIGAEALALMQRSGLAMEKLPLALEHHATKSATLVMKLGQMISRDFEPHFSVKHMLKDVRIGRAMAERLQLDLPVTDAATAVLQSSFAQGDADADFSAVAKKYFPTPPPEAAPAAPSAERVPPAPPVPASNGAIENAAPRESAATAPGETVEGTSKLDRVSRWFRGRTSARDEAP